MYFVFLTLYFVPSAVLASLRGGRSTAYLAPPVPQSAVAGPLLERVATRLLPSLGLDLGWLALGLACTWVGLNLGWLEFGVA